MNGHENMPFSIGPSMGTLTLDTRYLYLSNVRPHTANNSNICNQVITTTSPTKDWDSRSLPYLAAVALEPLGLWDPKFESRTSSSGTSTT
jgi:hypothetical protein